jgi:hypothetical protein
MQRRRSMPTAELVKYRPSPSGVGHPLGDEGVVGIRRHPSAMGLANRLQIERLLIGADGLVGIHRLVHGPGRAVVRDAAQRMLGGRRRVTSMRLIRIKFRPGRELSTCFHVRIDGHGSPVPVAVTWHSQAPQDGRLLSDMERRLRETGIPTPFENLWFTASSGLLQITAAPLDPVFPSLVSLANPVSTRDLLPDPAATSIRFTRYRPGQRHVIAYCSRAGEPCLFAKLYRPAKFQPVADAVMRFAQAAAAAGPDVRAVRPVAVLEELHTLLYAGLRGAPLSRCLKSAKGLRAESLRTVGQWMRAVHAPAQERAAPGGWSISYEARRVMRACAGIAGLREDLAARARSVVEVAAGRLETVEAERPTLVHGDMKADHLFLVDDGIAVLDPDRCAIADPALDLGKLLADLRWWEWVTGNAFTELEAALLAGYRADAARLRRARLFAALLLVKMAGRRVSVARRDWTVATSEVIDIACGLLDQDLAGDR